MQKLNKKNLYKELNLLLYNKKYINHMMSDYKELLKKVGGPGASDRFSKIMIDLLLNKYRINK